eukprot:497190-Ditylum_brightwellii.AAC.1
MFEPRPCPKLRSNPDLISCDEPEVKIVSKPRPYPKPRTYPDQMLGFKPKMKTVSEPRLSPKPRTKYRTRLSAYLRI